MSTVRSPKNDLKNRLPFLASLVIAVFLASGPASAQNPQPIFPFTTLVNLPEATLSTPPAMADFNGDGIPDLAYVTSVTSNEELQYSLNIALSFGQTGSTTVTTPLCLSQGPLPAFIVGDVNKDGKADIVATCNGYIMVLFGNGDGSFQKPFYYPLNTSNPPVLVDLNGDGYVDIAISVSGTTSTSPAQVAVFLNKGSGEPGIYGSPQMYLAANTYTYGLTAGDFNGDGKQDLIASTDSGFVLLFGNGDGTLRAAQSQSFSSAPCTGVAGDFNHDGITDLACAPFYPSGTTAPVQIFFRFNERKPSSGSHPPTGAKQPHFCFVHDRRGSQWRWQP